MEQQQGEGQGCRGRRKGPCTRSGGPTKWQKQPRKLGMVPSEDANHIRSGNCSFPCLLFPSSTRLHLRRVRVEVGGAGSRKNSVVCQEHSLYLTTKWSQAR